MRRVKSRVKTGELRDAWKGRHCRTHTCHVVRLMQWRQWFKCSHLLQDCSINARGFNPMGTAVNHPVANGHNLRRKRSIAHLVQHLKQRLFVGQ